MEKEKNKTKPWQASMMECDKCAYEWAAAHPVAAEYLECPICHHMTSTPIRRNEIIKTKIDYVERQTFRQEPDIYAGETCDKHRPRWMTSYPKEGDEEDGETLKLEMPAGQWPPGTRVTIEIPCCPKCGDPSDIKGFDGTKRKKWPNCHCGFSWRKWVEERFG